LLLVYAFLGAWNARSIYHLWWLEYRPYIPWLPHSYDQSKSWDYLLQFLGLAGIFLAARDWLCFGHNHSISAPPRLHRLLWIISINGGLLALEGLVQRLSGETRLLWLVEPFVNKTADAQFGPFAYRANAAQYFNLLWPVSLAFWLALRKRAVDASGSFWQRHRCKFLMVSILLMALCPAVALSRAGWSVLVFELVIASVIVTLSLRKGSTNVGGAVALAVVIVLGVGFYLEGERLWSRFQTLEEGYNDRAALYSVGDQISDDNPVFGVGGGAFSTVYQFYRVSLDDYLPAQMHNDWLEALINLGWVGLIVSLLPLLGILFRWFLPGGGIRVEWPTICLFWLGMGGCMLHACVDFPFQIESILVLFTVYCSQLSVFSRA